MKLVVFILLGFASCVFCYNQSNFCNFTGVALFCQEKSHSMDFKVCYACVNNTPVCRTIPNRGMMCRNGMVHIQECYCATYNYKYKYINFGRCIYHCSRKPTHIIEDGYTLLPQNNISKLNITMCRKSLNRDKALCGRCLKGYYPLAYSYNLSCIKCPKSKAVVNWLYLVLYIFVPLTLFCFFIMFFNINVASSHLHGFVLFSQAITAPVLCRLVWLTSNDRPQTLFFSKFIGLFYSLWNFDILRQFTPELCIHGNTFDITIFDLYVGVYALFLLLCMRYFLKLYDHKCFPLVLLWKPFKRLTKLCHSCLNPKTSLVDSFATFLLLTNVKFLSGSFDNLVFVRTQNFTYSGDVKQHYVLYMDATQPLFTFNRHLIFAFVMLVIFVIFPITILFLYPFRIFQRCLNYIVIPCNNLHTFMDSFQGGYKNGMDPNTRDCRYFSAIFLLCRLLLYLIYALTLSSVFFCFAPILVVMLVILIITIQPFKNSQHNYVNAYFLIVLAMWYASVAGISITRKSEVFIIEFFYHLSVIISVVPIVSLAVILAHWLWERKAS